MFARSMFLRANLADDKDSVVLRFACACNKVTGSVRVPAHEIPLPLEFCHCNICRHQSGLLAQSLVTLPKTARQFEVNGPTTSYESSKLLSRRFCSHCGSNVYIYTSEHGAEGLSDICSGVLADSETFAQMDRHIWIADTKDGGLSAWLHEYPGWEQSTKTSKPIDCSTHAPSSNAQPSSELNCYCQCRGVEFKITRPTKASRESLSSPWSDLLRPYVSGPSDNKDDVKWWLRANDTKFLAGNCACNSCRLNSGFDLNQWAFVPKLIVLQKDGKSLDYNMGTLKQYESSKGCHRNFCGRCGATVFFHNDERPALVDVAVGVLDAEDGARAESWLEWWTKRVSFSEDAQNKHLTTSLLDGLKRWAAFEGVSSNTSGA